MFMSTIHYFHFWDINTVSICFVFVWGWWRVIKIYNGNLNSRRSGARNKHKCIDFFWELYHLQLFFPERKFPFTSFCTIWLPFVCLWLLLSVDRVCVLIYHYIPLIICIYSTLKKECVSAYNKAFFSLHVFISKEVKKKLERTNTRNYLSI